MHRKPDQALGVTWRIRVKNYARCRCYGGGSKQQHLGMEGRESELKYTAIQVAACRG